MTFLLRSGKENATQGVLIEVPEEVGAVDPRRVGGADEARGG